MRYAPGSPAELQAVFTDSYGNLKDPETIHVDIFDATGNQVLDNGEPTRVSEGNYEFTYEIPEDAPTGLWRAEWQAIVEGLNAFGQDIFEVELFGSLPPSTAVVHSRLRSRLGESSSLPPEQNGSDTMFTNDQIADLLAYANGDLDIATLEGWKRKAATLSRLIDISESGSDRALSQRYKHASDMLDFWTEALAGVEEARAIAMSGRVVGKVVNLRKLEDPNPGTPFSGYGENIRAYPTHRLLIPAIMG